MRKLLLAVVIVVVAGAGALAWSFQPRPLAAGGDAPVQVPSASPPPTMKISVLDTGRMFAKGAFAYRGGAFDDERAFAMAPVLVEHPQGALLIDSGFGSRVDEHFLTTPWLAQTLARYEKRPSAAAQLRAAGYDLAQLKAVVLTHAHWDHVSGLDDLRDTPVWLPQAELDLIKLCDKRARLACSFGALPYRVYDFPDGPYLGFAASYDVYKDGAVVIVPAPGHTPGSVIVFVTPPGERRYAFVGDLAWQKEGIDLPAERPWLARSPLKEDAAQVREALVHMHRLQRNVPGLTVVPAHDARVIDTLPRFGA